MPTAYPGIGVSRGIAIGKARILQHGQVEVLEYTLPTSQLDSEVQRFRHALAQAREQLLQIRARIPGDTPGNIAAFIETHLLMLDDATLAEEPEAIIRAQHCNAEWALKLQADALLRAFATMDDAYLKTRCDDVIHVVRRVQQLLLQGGEGHEPLLEESAEPRIAVAADLSPGDLVLLHQQNISAIVTERGGPLSHTAILARSLRIPAIVGIPHVHDYINNHEWLVVDGNHGTLLSDPDAATTHFYQCKQASEQAAYDRLQTLTDQACRSSDGIPITLQANIELPEDIAELKRVGAEGVGLYRTEFLFLNREQAPSEEEQFTAYRETVESLNGAPLTIRTLDLGADKAFVPVRHISSNPVLGLRAVRLCLNETSLFKPQLRAILRASVYGPVQLLIPMLTNTGEIDQCLHLLNTLKRELRAQHIPFDEQLPVGGMIEIPAAALCVDQFARRLDFLAIGTNDLIQYTLATDRIDEAVNHLYDPLNLAVLRLIRHIIRSANEAEIPVSLCGEMAATPSLTRLLLALGLTRFSLPPTTLLEVKHVINHSNIKLLQQQIHELLQCGNEALLRQTINELNSDLPELSF